MSRVFDQYMPDKIEINGVLVSIIEPNNHDELMKAFAVKDLLETQYYSLMHDDEDKDLWLSRLQEQESYIKDYISKTAFDNGVLIKNIAYLAKKAGLGTGNLESYLGLSAGYISRTAKADSRKRMSIDVVWAISRIFDVDLEKLLSCDLSIPSDSVTLISDFISNLKSKTLEGEIIWENYGGCVGGLNPRLVSTGLFHETTKGTVYYSDGEHSENKWMISNDIYAFEGFSKGKDLLIITYISPDDKHNPDPLNESLIAFVLIDSGKNSCGAEKMFSLCRCPFEHLQEEAVGLINIIINEEYTPYVKKEHRELMKSFIKEN